MKKWNVGPGIVTGAADDDPSGIATFALAGARFGFSMLWVSLFTIPFMAAVQEMCARIGMETKVGLMGALKKCFPHKRAKPFLVLLAGLVFLANTLNVGADVSAMVATTRLLVAVPEVVLAIIYVVVLGFLVVVGSYKTVASVFKWLSMILFLYIFSALLAHLNWKDVLMGTLFPKISWTKDYFMMLVAMLGTTISPYLFFWQASEEVEEKEEDARLRGISRIELTKKDLGIMRKDVLIGMAFSNIAMYFVVAATAGTLHAHGITNVLTPVDAAVALEPVAGRFSALFFTLGVLGTGMLAIPVLAGSAAYAVGETFDLSTGLNKSWQKARGFYGIFIAALVGGLILSVVGFDPIKLLFYTAVVFGVISPPLIALVLWVANSKRVMGDRVNGGIANTLGFMTLLIMSVAAVVMFVVT